MKKYVLQEKMKTAIKSYKKLTPTAIRKICRAAWGYDAVKIALNYLSDKLDGYECYADSFDVSYQGTLSELRRELVDVLESAGIDDIQVISRGKITYDDGSVEIEIYKLPEGMDFSLTKDSIGYSIDVVNVF